MDLQSAWEFCEWSSRLKKKKYSYVVELHITTVVEY